MTTKTYDRQTGKFLARVAENMPEMNSDVMQGWIENPSALQKFLAGLNPPQEVSRSARLVVNYSLSLPEMIAAGRYDWVNSNITGEHFPIIETGVKEIVVEAIYFDRNMSSEDAVKELARRGLRPATLAELLAYGVARPDEQRKYPIVALGSVAEVRGERGIPCHYGDGSERRLDLGWWDGDWNGLCRFLSVRN